MNKQLRSECLNDKYNRRDNNELVLFIIIYKQLRSDCLNNKYIRRDNNE